MGTKLNVVTHRAGEDEGILMIIAASHVTANCILIDQFPIENHSEQGRFAELPLKTIGKSAKFGRLLCNSQYA
jgi:hypothetical protein